MKTKCYLTTNEFYKIATILYDEDFKLNHHPHTSMARSLLKIESFLITKQYEFMPKYQRIHVWTPSFNFKPLNDELLKQIEFDSNILQYINNTKED